MKDKCNRHIKLPRVNGFCAGSYECEKVAKIKASYLSPTSNKKISEVLCGTHYQSLLKWAKMIKNKTGFDCNIVTYNI